MVSGEFDLLVEVMCKDRDELTVLLNEHIRVIDGVTRTQTFFIFHTYKMAYGALPVLPSEKIKKELEDIPITEPSIILHLTELIKNALKDLESKEK